MGGVMGRILRCFNTLLLVLSLVLALFFVIGAYSLGWQLSPVLSNGMSPTFKIGDVVMIEPVQPEAIGVGDIMVYYCPLDGKRIAHRVIGIRQMGEDTFFQTKADSNEKQDPYLVPAENITGRAKFHIPLLGYMAYFVKTPLGFALLLGLPGLILTTMETGRLFWILIPREKRRQKSKWATGLKRKEWIG
jgi:signal peptidase